MNRKISVSFAFEFTFGQWSRSTENRTSAFGDFYQHLFRDILSSFIAYHFFSERRPMNDHCPVPNFLAYKDTTLACARHSSSLSFVPQEMSLNIDMNKILPVKFSGVSPNLLSKSLTLPQSCNV